MRNVLINEALERTLSRDRLHKYLETCNQDLDQAIALYEKNARISEAFYTPLQSLEICLRNCLHQQLKNTFSEEWFHDPAVPFNNDSHRMIFDAVEELKRERRDLSAGKVIAELKFSFWVGLLGPQYDSTIWRTSLYKAFSTGAGKPRRQVHARFNALRRFRNRIAHHEPIFHRPIIQMHDEIIEAIGWMCRDTAAWARHHSRLPSVA